jgi:hypothetical protein
LAAEDTRRELQQLISGEQKLPEHNQFAKISREFCELITGKRKPLKIWWKRRTG